MWRTLQCRQAILSCRTALLPYISPSPQSSCLKIGVIRVRKQCPYDLPPLLIFFCQHYTALCPPHSGESGWRQPPAIRQALLS